MNLSQANIRRLSVALTMGALVALGLLLYAPVFGDFPRALITDPIEENHLVTLAHNTRPEATPENDRGPVPDSFPLQHMLLQLKRSPVMEAELVQYIDQLTDKKSPNFRHWLTPQQIGDRYGMQQQDLDTIKNWLQSHGLIVGYTYPTRMVMDVSGTAAQIAEAFHTEIHYYEVNGKSHFANATDPRIPAALAPAVTGVVSMHDFLPHAMAKPRIPSYTLGGGDYTLVPADFQTIYNISPLYRAGIYGQGQTIVVVEDTDSYGSDFTTFQTTFGLIKYGGSLVTAHPNFASNCTDPGTNADDGEADIDVETVAAIAPGATVELASCTDTATFGGLIAIENLVSAGTPPAVLSMSYGECEVENGAASNAAFYSAFQSAAAAGVSVFVSSGDESAVSCSANATSATTGIGVTGWGETPYNVSVGGTDFEDAYNAAKPANAGLPQSTYWSSSNGPTYGSAKSYIPEIPWNDSCAGYLLYNIEGYPSGYGSSGLCSVSTYRTTGSGSGGPSGCATGTPSITNVVSGTCAGYPKPSWQSFIFGNPADGVRDIPDVALFASNGIWGHYVVVCWSDPAYTTDGSASCAGAPNTWSGFGGTSISSPTMASIQALVNQKWNIRAGLPTPTYYSIAGSEFGASGNPACYSINQQQPRRGQESSCVFYDITQGDIDVNCTTSTGCYKPSGTYGSMSTQAPATALFQGGSGYTSAPTCTIAAPSNLNSYLSPTNVVLWTGGTQAAGCTATVTAGTTTQVSTLKVSAGPATTWAGAQFTVGSVTYTFVVGTPTAVNQVELYTASTTSTNETDTAKQIQAVIANNSADCVTAGCVPAGQTANPAVTATESTSTVTLTATAAGAAGTFAVALNNNAYSDLTTLTTTAGNGPNYVSAVAFTGGQGYAPGTSCTITGVGTGAVCSLSPLVTTAATAWQPAYGTTPGWDMATGLGSVNAYNLVFNSAW